MTKMLNRAHVRVTSVSMPVVIEVGEGLFLLRPGSRSGWGEFFRSPEV